MSGIRVRHLMNPTGDELDQAAETVTTALENTGSEPAHYFYACIDGNWNFSFAFNRSILAAAALAGEIWVAERNGEDFVGVAAWLKPGRELLDSPDQGEAGFNELMSWYDSAQARWFMNDFVKKSARQSEGALGAGGATSAWYLQLLGVLPSHQKKGVAKSLLEAIELRERRGTVFTMLAEGRANVRIYRKLGYELYDVGVPYRHPKTEWQFYTLAKRL